MLPVINYSIPHSPLYQPKSLKELAQAKVKIPERTSVRPLKGGGVPYSITKKGPGSCEASTLMGMSLLRTYMVMPTVCDLYKNISIENPRIAIVPFYMDQLGDIRIILDLRSLIVAKFGVEPLIIANKENQRRTLEYLKNSPEANGLIFIDLDNVNSKDCQGLDLLIHGPAVDGAESQNPKNIIYRYPKLENAIDYSNPPVIFSLLESESSSFSYSAPVDEGGFRAHHMINTASGVLAGLGFELMQGTFSTKNRDYISWQIPLYIAAAKYLNGLKESEMSNLLGRISAAYQKSLDSPYSIPTIYQVTKLSDDVEAFKRRNSGEIESKYHNGPIIQDVASTRFALAISPKHDSHGVKFDRAVCELSVLQLGLNPIFSMGCFKLSKDLYAWKKNGLIESAEGRKSIINSLQEPVFPEEKSLLNALRSKSFVFGYAHDDSVKMDFVEHSFKLNPDLDAAVINMDFEEAVRVFPNYNIVCHNPISVLNRCSRHTVHLYKDLTNRVFNGLMASSDPCCRLAGGDNTLFTTLMLGTDDLVYDLRGFKVGMILALFKLANELSLKEKDCIVDRMLSSAGENTLITLRWTVPEEFAGYAERNSKRTLSLPGSHVYTQAFRKIGNLIRAKAEIFEATLTGFMKLQILKRRNPLGK